MCEVLNLSIYTDGACSGNPGPGGPGFVFVQGDAVLHVSHVNGFRKTTNNRMEIKAVSLALQQLLSFIKEESGIFQGRRETDIKVTVFSDSQLVVKTLTEGWSKKTNKDLWNELDEVISNLDNYRPGHIVIEFRWVKGHDKNKWNNLADELAVEASHNCNDIDEVYENISPVKKTSLLFEPIESEAEPTIKEVRLQGFNTPENRKVLVTLSNGTEVTIAPCHGGFQQYGCTKAESQVTIDIALKFAKWLNGSNL